MITGRGIPPNDTVSGIRPIRCIRRLLTRSVFQLAYKEINISLNCRLNPLLIPAGLRTITLKENGGIIPGGSVPNHKTKAFCICVTHSHSLFAINGRLGGFGGLRRRSGSRGTATRGTSVTSVTSVSARRSFGGGNLLVALVVCPRLISGAATGGLLGACTPLTVRAYAVPALELLHLCGGQRTVIVAGRCGFLGLRLNLRLRLRLRFGLGLRLRGVLFVVSGLLSLLLTVVLLGVVLLVSSFLVSSPLASVFCASDLFSPSGFAVSSGF